MSIWLYNEYQRGTNNAKEAYKLNCIFCSTELIRDTEDEDNVMTFDSLNYGFSDNFRTSCSAVVGICPICGWWKYGVGTYVGGNSPTSYEMKEARLKKLDLLDLTIPLNDVRSYLAARYEARFSIHPQTFEKVVASVFKDHGFLTRVTAYSGDGGIDVILEGKEGGSIGVQVKRYKDRISVAQIRELVGALVLNGYTKGIFVTTSEFQSGVSSLTALSAERGYPIELIDATSFLEELKIAQLATHEEILEKKPWGEVRKWDY